MPSISPPTILKADALKLLELKQSSPERFTLLFDNGTELKTTLSVITDRFLHAGAELNDDEYRELCAASSLSLCKMRALRIINTRTMSRKEMSDRLREKGEMPENAELCADWLCDMGLIDDAQYAGSVVRHYAAKGYGVSRIKSELNRHGVARELWDEALLQMPEQDDYMLRFLSSRLNDPDDKAQVKKVTDALFRKGYTWEQIRHALNTFIAQEDFK